MDTTIGPWKLVIPLGHGARPGPDQSFFVSYLRRPARIMATAPAIAPAIAQATGFSARKRFLPLPENFSSGIVYVTGRIGASLIF